MQWFQELLRELRGNGSSAFPQLFNYADLVRAWWNAYIALKLKGCAPYRLRLSAPSHDRAQRVRSWKATRMRRRWRQMKPGKQGEEAGKMALEAMRLSTAIQRYASDVAKNLEGYVKGEEPPPSLPRVSLR